MVEGTPPLRPSRRGPAVPSPVAWVVVGVVLVAVAGTWMLGGDDPDVTPEATVAPSATPSATVEASETDASGAVSTPTEPAETVVVVRLADGDSFDVADGEARLTIRMAQVDAPELDECFGRDARDWLSGRILGELVRLEETANGPDRDEHDRRLREVWRGATSLNVEIVRLGYARHGSFFADEDPDLAARMAAAQDEAEAHGRGLWSACPQPALGAPRTVAAR